MGRLCTPERAQPYLIGQYFDYSGELSGPGISAGTYPARSAFDVVPTIVEMLGARLDRPISGESFYVDICQSALEQATH